MNCRCLGQHLVSTKMPIRRWWLCQHADILFLVARLLLRCIEHDSLYPLRSCSKATNLKELDFVFSFLSKSLSVFIVRTKTRQSITPRSGQRKRLLNLLERSYMLEKLIESTVPGLVIGLVMFLVNKFFNRPPTPPNSGAKL